MCWFYWNFQEQFDKYRFTSCNIDYSDRLDEELRKCFISTFTFSNNFCQERVFIPINAKFKRENVNLTQLLEKKNESLAIYIWNILQMYIT